MKTLKLGISGMTCDHCAATAQDALNGLAGVSARVSFEDGAAEIDAEPNVTVQGRRIRITLSWRPCSFLAPDFGMCTGNQRKRVTTERTAPRQHLTA